MTFYLKAFPYRLILSIVVVSLVYFTPTIIGGNYNDIPVYYTTTILIVFFCHQVRF